MSTSRDGPNPLRPYYRPPSIGVPQDTPGAASSGTHGLGPKNGSAASYASSAREMFSDIDYSDYLSDSSPSSLETVRKTVDEWFYLYVAILFRQPFDVAKTVLQVKCQDATDGSIPVPVVEEIRNVRSSSYRDSMYSDYLSDDSDPDEPAYFTSTAPSSHSYSPSRSRRRHESDQNGYTTPPKPAPNSAQKLILRRSNSVLEVISQEWTKEGVWGVWKGSNTTFVYSLLTQTIEGWSRSLLSALLNVPEPGSTGLGISAELLDAPYPWASLGVAVAAALATGLILAPLDLVRTKLILTPTSAPKRSITQNLRALPSYFCPSALVIPTILHSLVTPTINHSTPLLLRTHLAIDPLLTPTTYSLAKFFSQTMDLFIKLPLETVLRRGQVAVLTTPAYRPYGQKELETIVDVGPYRGVVGTMWSIVRDEGTSIQEIAIGTGGAKVAKKGKKVERKGQGIEGLWRGWRVGMWGLAGNWAAKSLAGTGDAGGEF